MVAATGVQRAVDVVGALIVVPQRLLLAAMAVAAAAAVAVLECSRRGKVDRADGPAQLLV